MNFPIEVRSDMETNGKRESVRMELEVPIEVVGTDCLGIQFFDRTHAVVIGRHGGKIVLERKLGPHQEVSIRCLATGQEAEATVVGLIGKRMGAYHYGIKFVGGEDNIWGVEFPPSTDPEGAIGRVFLECLGCKNREVVCLDDFETEVLEVTGQLSRSCKRCRDVSLWRKLQEMPDSEIATSASAHPAVTQRPDKRHEPRRQMRVAACVRTARCGEDLVQTRSVSRSGLCFTSPWEYLPGEAIEVAVPYSPGGGNIFLSAEVVRLQLLPSEGTRIYGVVFQHRKA
jgi:hypothetical protein